jgi:hypothetical protein
MPCAASDAGHSIAAAWTYKHHSVEDAHSAKPAMRLTLGECSFEHPAFVSLDWSDMKVERLSEHDNPPPASPDMGVFLTLFVEDCPDSEMKEAKSFVSKGNRIFRRAKQINGQLPRGPKSLLSSQWGFVVDQVVGPFRTNAHDLRKIWRKKGRAVASRRQIGREIAVATRTRLFESTTRDTSTPL